MRARALALILVVTAGAACGDERPEELCAGAPVETYDTFGRGFLTFHCQGCHASATPDRLGAPVDVVFDTKDDALRQRDRILARAAGDAPTMPPAGGTTDEDRARLEIWLRCFE